MILPSTRGTTTTGRNVLDYLGKGARRLLKRALPSRAIESIVFWRGEPELRLVEPLLGSSGSLIDVGANSGPYSMLAKRLGHPVIAFEPNPVVARRLATSLGSYGRVHVVALSDREGSANLYIPVSGGEEISTRATLEDDSDHIGNRETVLEVDVRTLDSFGIQGVGLVKIDVEGHEWQVLKGSARTISRELPNLIIEIEEFRSPGGMKRCSDFLLNLGYQGYFVLRGQIYPVSEFYISENQSPELRPVWGKRQSRSYVNNFVWISPLERNLTLDLARHLRLRHGWMIRTK